MIYNFINLLLYT